MAIPQWVVKEATADPNDRDGMETAEIHQNHGISQGYLTLGRKGIR